MTHDPRIQELAQQFAARIGPEAVADIMRWFLDSYTEAAGRKARGETLPPEVPLRIPVEVEVDQESADLIGALLGVMLEAARRQISDQN